MARKPIPVDEHRQRTLEAPEDGPLRARIRDADEERARRDWARGVLRRSLGYGAATIAAIAWMRDELVGAVGWLWSILTGGGGQ